MKNLNGIDENDLKILKRSPIFHGIHTEELAEVISSLSYSVHSYQKGEVIFSEDEKPRNVMILLSGLLTLASDTVNGKRIVLSIVNMPGELFGEIYAFIGLPYYDMYAMADFDSRVLFVSSEIVKPEDGDKLDSCGRIQEIIRNNLIRVFATKAYSMNRRLRILGGGNIREKIVRYIHEHHLGGDYVVTPTREAWADYLNVTRPSLSRELSHMAAENLIRISGRKIYIIEENKLEEYL